MEVFAFIIASLLFVSEAETDVPKTQYKWDNNLELSYISTTGNTNNATLAGKLAINANREQNSIFFKADTILQKKDGVETGNDTDLKGRYERKSSEKMFVLLESKFERDRFSGFNYRFSGGPGFGYNILNSESTNLKAFASLQYHFDRPNLTTEESDRYTAAKITLNGIFDIKKNLQLKNDLDYSQSTKDLSRYFINNETALKVKINSIVSIGIRYKIKYESLPAREDLEKLNSTFLTSLGFHWAP